MNEGNTLGEYLRAAREEAGLSLRQAATATGTNHGYLARLESGEKKNPSAEMLQRIADALEVNAADLFLLAGLPMPDQPPSIAAMLRTEYDLPEEAIAEAQRNIDAIVEKYNGARTKRQK